MSRNSFLVVLAALVSLEVFSQSKSCWPCRQPPYITQFFLSPLFLCFFILEFQNLFMSVPSVSFVLFCSLSIFSILLFFSTLLSVPCYVFSFCLFTLFSNLPCFLFKSVILSFLFLYYSILSASPLCCITLQSVLLLFD